MTTRFPICVASLLVACAAEAGQVHLPITTDAYVDSRSSNTGRNYGAATTVKTTISSTDGSVTRGLLQLPPEIALYDTGQITRATVVFYVWQDNTEDRNVTLYPLARSFVEGTGNGAAPADGATWQTYDGTNAWTTPGGDFDTNFPIAAVKGPILDEDLHDRFFTWDITPLLTNETARTALMNYGALLQIDEVPLPSSGTPRAPFTSSDDPAYDAAYRPHLELVVIPRTAAVAVATLDAGANAITLALTNCTPFITNRIERSFNLAQPDGWTLVTNLVTTGNATNWSASLENWTNACYRIVGE